MVMFPVHSKPQTKRSSSSCGTRNLYDCEAPRDHVLFPHVQSGYLAMNSHRSFFSNKNANPVSNGEADFGSPSNSEAPGLKQQCPHMVIIPAWKEAPKAHKEPFQARGWGSL